MQFLKPFFIVAMLLISAAAGAQKSYHIPEDINWDGLGGHMQYKQDIIDATDYLSSVPLGSEAGNRKKVSVFILAWLTGSPDVTVVMFGKIIEPMKDGDLLILYSAGWARYVLQSGDTSRYAGNIAGVRTVVDFYKNPANKVPRNKKLEQWVRKQETGSLDAYVTGLMKSEANQK